MIPNSVDGVSDETHRNENSRSNFICGVVEGMFLLCVMLV